MYIFPTLAGSPGRIHRMAVAFALTLALASCASVPPPNDSMNMAQLQLQAARDAGAADYAPVDLGFAQDKFQQAQAAMADRKYADAANLAEESRADAELAQAKARLGATRTQMQNKVQENSHLRAEGEQADSQDQAPPSASSSSNAAPPEDMPAPSSSALSPPPQGAGFQTLPTQGQQPDPNAQGGQP